MNRKRQNVEALYPLSPMQQGMLFHTAYAADSGVYVTHVVLTLEGRLEAEALRQAWQTVVERHAVLRTAFVWEHYDKPFQIVQRQVVLPWRYEDWRELDAATQEQQQHALLEQDLQQGFSLKQAPLIRLALLRLGEQTHRLIWSLHHLLMDGWSLPLVLNEVLVLYQAQVQGVPARLPVPRPYREYIAWLQAQDMGAAEAFWRRRLAGFRAPTPLVVDQTKPGPAGTEEQALVLSQATSAALQELVQRHGLTMSTLVQAAWAILLSRYSGESDVLFGVTVSGRPSDLPGVEQMVGLFINTLPMRVQVAPEQPLIALLQTILAHQLEAQQFEYSPLVEIQGWSEVPRGQPLFESFVLFENYPASSAGSGGPGQLSVTTHRGVERTNYPLNLIATAGQQLELRLNYDRQRFAPVVVGRMLGHLATLLDAMAAGDAAPVGRLPLLTETEQRQLLVDWNATGADRPAASLPELFAQQVAHTPHRPAVSFGEQTLTYAELDAWADQLAQRLRQAGAGPEMPVGVYLERSVALPVALLAVLKADGAYLPLDPSFPHERLAWMLEDSGAPILLTSQSLADQLPPHRAQVLCVEQECAPLNGDAQLPATPAGTQLAYLIYTSGSTGRPKGVMVPHRALSNFLLAMRARPGLRPDDTLLAVTTLSFDIAALELFLPLTIGAHVVLADRASAADGALLAGLLRRWQASVMQATPATWSMLLEAGWNDGTDLTALCGGEALPPTLANRLLDSGVRLWNMYGPTETTIWSLIDPVETHDTPVTIGRPIANTSVYVLDHQLSPVPVGVPGQLYIGGDGVARGYWNRPDLTAERFVPNPFGVRLETRDLRLGAEESEQASSRKPQASRLYRTGDLVRYREDGRLEFLGRTDFQVKLRGFRIELAEIETALMAHPQVGVAVVALREDRPGDQRLVAYIIPAEEPRTKDQEPGTDDTERKTQHSTLKTHLRERLPEYMIPSAFVTLERFPLTPNGKIDRRALPAPEPPADKGRPELPRTPVEQMLAGIWADVLHLPQVGIRDSFFDLGGHSLLATQLTARIRATLGVDLTLRTLFQHPTIAELAAQIAQLRAASGLLAPPLTAQERPALLPLSFAQQRMWFLAQLDPDTVTYTVPVALRLGGRLDRAALAASLDALVARHESLRTCFPHEHSQPRQQILPAAPVLLSQTDLGELPESERLGCALAQAHAAIQRRFDLERGPLLRAELLALAEDDHVLLLALHHIISDGWSLEVLLRDLHALYTAHRQGQPNPLPPLPIQYADYAIWQRGWLEGGVLEAQLDYWRTQLAGLQPLDLPADFPRLAVPGQSGATHRFAIGAQTLEALAALGRRQHVTPFMLLLAVWQLLLARYSGQDDIAVGTPVSNRGHSATDQLIGIFVNTIVLRSDLSQANTFQELLAQVREMCLAAYDHQDIPFEQLVDALEPERNLNRYPLFQVMFTLQTSAPMPDWPDLTLTPLLVETGAVKFDLSLALVQHSDGVEGLLEYRSDLFTPATAERMARHFVALLEAALAQPQAPLHSLPLLTAEEQAALARWSETGPALPWCGSLPLRLRAIAQQTPAATALLDATGAHSFATLLGQAEHLAAHLAARTAQSEQPVALLLERTAALPAALLAVWLAGRTLLPLDPSLPPARIAQLLSDARPALVLASPSLSDALADDLPWPVCLLDDLLDAPAPRPFVPAELAPEQPAYLIYTSGSTGTPKAVLASHGSLLAILDAASSLVDYRPGDVQPVMASAAFDIFLFELFAPLLAGAAAHILSRDAVLALAQDPAPLAGWSVLHAVPSLLRVLIDALETQPELPRSLRHVLVGGDRVPPDLLAQARRVLPEADLTVLYGPTETTILATAHRVGQEQTERDGHAWLGRPLAGVRVQVLDRHGQPVPAGVTGELFIGGAGVSLGYLNQPDLTAERFVLRDGLRWYRSGDQARWLQDGSLIFAGRVDGQIKLRGFRIELGEIETVARQHPGVHDAVVLAQDDPSGEKRLVAYVVHNSAQPELWPSIGEYFVYDELIYYGLTSDERRNEKYKAAMERLVRDKVVVDIGTGRDAIQARLCIEAGARRVYAIEILEESYLHARRVVQQLGLEDRITVIHGNAMEVELPELADVCVSEIVEAIGGAEGAAPILNNVRRLLRPDGAFIPSRSLTKIAAVTLPDELVTEPMFTAVAGRYVEKIFAQIGHPFDVRLCVKSFPRANLLSDVQIFEDLDFTSIAGTAAEEYRHEVRFRIERAGRMDGFLLWLNLQLDSQTELDILEEPYSWFPVYFPIFYPGIVVAAGDTIEALCEARLCDNRINPDYRIAGRLIRADGTVIPFDYESVHHQRQYRATPYYAHLFRNETLPVEQGSRQTVVARQLRDFLGERLPSYMVPSAVVMLEHFPLTPNGKLDRKALPEPGRQQGDEGLMAPRTPIEELLATIWAEVLELPAVGVHDNFFALGGHSLRATQVVARIRPALGVELPVRVLFEAPTVAELAAWIGQQASAPELLPPPLVAQARPATLPLSFAQQRLWFLQQLDPASVAYNMPSALRLHGALDQAALERSLEALVARHESLRTRFPAADGAPQQQILDPMPLALPLTDLRGLEESERLARALELAQAEAQRPFDLAEGPLLRATLLALAEDDHILLLNMHHIISDGWSVGVLVGELAQVYGLVAQGQASNLPALPVQYADYALWQRGWLQGVVLEAQLDYWRSQLAGLQPLNLPSDFPRRPQATSAGAVFHFTIDAETAGALRSLTQHEDASMFMALLAVWQLLLARYSGQDDIAVGTPIAGRSQQATEGLIGCFVNTLVLRSDLARPASFRELLAQVREMCLAAYAHQDIPFEQLVDVLAPERDLSIHPLFQVMFALQSRQGQPVDWPGVAVEQLLVDYGSVKFDLSLSLADAEDQILAVLEYRSDLFAPGTVARMAEHFCTLLAALVAHPDQPLPQASLLSGEEQAALAGWSEGAPALPWRGSLPLRLRAIAQQTPHATALLDATGAHSFAALLAQAKHLAAHLAARTAQNEQPVALLLERTAALPAALLAVWLAGRILLPLDPSLPPARIAQLLSDARPALVLVSPSLSGALAADAPWPVCLLDALLDAPTPQPFVPAVLAPEQPAYLIYTSGSTGTPKAVLASHGGLLAILDAASSLVNYRPGDVQPVMASAAFDIFLFELFAPLLAGAAAHILGRDAVLALAQNPAPLAGWSVLHAVPSLLRVLLDALETQPELPRRLRHILVGGDRVPPELLVLARRVLPEAELTVLYGPTETTILATAHRVTGAAGEDGHAWLGRPLAGVRVQVLDRHGQPVPAGVTGELFIGGAGVSLGYLNQPELTAERFVLRDGLRWYRSGDQARWLQDGSLVFAGRVDGQVKLRGFRIELGEIEAVLARHPLVAEALVLVRGGEQSARLVAYVVPQSQEPRTKNQEPQAEQALAGAERSIERAQLQAFLAERLPEYMVPSAFVVLERFPLTPNGKLDHKALPEPEETSVVASVAPRTPVEELLASIWAEVLELPAVGVHDNFFALGGHSLRATQVVARIRPTFGVELPVRVLFEAPTVAELAAWIGQQGNAPELLPPPLVAQARPATLPLSFAQQRLWFLQQLDPASVAYNMPSALRLHGALDQAALERSLEALVTRHESLRTRFPAADGAPQQQILDPMPLVLPLTDLRGLEESERLARALELAQIEGRQPFDLAEGPLLRATLLALAEDEHILLLNMHHIISDGWSWGRFFDELTVLYSAEVSHTSPRLPALPVQYADYALWQRNWLQGAVLEAQLDYWRSQLVGLQPLNLPSDFPRPAVPSFEGAQHAFELPPALSAELRRICQGAGVTLFMALLATWQLLLARYSGQDDIAVGTPIAGRSQQATERLIGCFVNTLVLRSDLARPASFRELLAQVREMCLAAYAHQDIPFEQLVDALVPERDLSIHPLFQVMFSLQSSSGAAPTWPGVELSALPVEMGSVKFDLSISLSEETAGLSGVLEYRRDLFAPGTVARMAQHFCTLLAALVAHPDQPLPQASLLSGEEQAALARWSETGPALPWRGSLPLRLHAIAQQTPHATALLDATGAHSFAALLGQAEHLAAHLAARTAQSEQPVALLLERTAALPAALLAVWLAGRTLLPLDPSLPPARIAQLLSDARPALVLVSPSLSGALAAGAPWPVCLLDALLDAPAPQPFAPAELAPEQPAYLIYTSGSTGTPKAVLASHGGLLAILDAASSLVNYRPGDVQPVMASAAFDIFLFELFAPLLAGAAAHILGRDAVLALAQDPAPLAGWSVLHAVPSLLRVLLDALETQPELPRRLRHILVGGDRVPPELLTLARRVLPEAELTVLYGPTETTILATAHRVGQEQTEHDAHAWLGRPLAGVRVQVLDRHGQPVPAGVTGELFIGGAGVSLGYLNQPDLTAERFVLRDGLRWYRSGDQARWLQDGALVFAGRVDGQIKLRGFRIELGEIEAVLARHPLVAETLVLVRGGEQNPRLVAYVVPQNQEPGSEHQEPRTKNQEPGTEQGPAGAERSIEQAQLQAFLAERLPEYMVPSAFVVLERFPLTPNGKIDRRALPEPDERPEDTALVAPRTPVEATLAEIWSAVLRVPSVGVHDNFFRLGGDSILSIQIVARAGQAGLRLTPRQLFQHQTIAELALVVERRSVQAPQGLVEGPALLTPIQRHFLRQERPARHHFNQDALLELPERVGVAALAQGLLALLAHHDALRLRFTHDAATGWRAEHAAPPAQAPLTLLDLSALPPEQHDAAQEHAAAAVQASLDLERGPLLRALLIERGPHQPQRLLLVVHHLVVDVVSWGVLLADLRQAVAQAQQGQPIQLPPKTSPWRDWAAALPDYTARLLQSDEPAYWTRVLQAAVPPLPRDHAHGPNTVADARHLLVALDEDETTALLQQVSAAYQTQTPDLLLTALAHAWREWTGSPLLRVALEGHGREEVLAPELDVTRTAGWFTAVYPLLLGLPAEAGPGAALKAIKEQIRQVPQHGVGYGLLREGSDALPPEPPLELSFNYLGQVDQTLGAGDDWRPSPSPRGPAEDRRAAREHLLDLTVQVVGGRLLAGFTYSPGLHEEATVRRLAESYLTALRELIAHCLSPEAGGFTPSDFPLAQLSDDTLDRLESLIDEIDESQEFLV